MLKTGLYFHIPFCKQACSYCNFHFSTQLKNMDDLVSALCIETEQRSTDNLIGSIYFGGGTPSLLKEKHWLEIQYSINKYFPNQALDEFTIEVNPEDITVTNLKIWNTIGVTRLSIGIQSLNDAELVWMNRVHNSEQASNSIKMAQENGFKNISIDLIYGGPLKTDDAWENELTWAFKQNIQHISAYALTIEPKTRLEYEISKGKSPELQDERMVSQFNILQTEMLKNGWDSYEISNYSLPGFNAIHNARYWDRMPYIGIGPGAHSFNGREIRRWNVANNARYIECLNIGRQFWEDEELNANNILNEYIMTAIRTSKGIDLHKINSFDSRWSVANQKIIESFITKELLLKREESLILTNEGKLVSDYITSELMIVG